MTFHEYKGLTVLDIAMLDALAKQLKQKHIDPERKLHDYPTLESLMKELKAQVAARTIAYYKERQKVA